MLGPGSARAADERRIANGRNARIGERALDADFALTEVGARENVLRNDLTVGHANALPGHVERADLALAFRIALVVATGAHDRLAAAVASNAVVAVGKLKC